MRRLLLQKCCNWCIQLSLLASFAAGAAQLSLSAADIVAPDFDARGIALILPEDGSADLRIAELHVQKLNLRNVHIRCARFALSTASVSCHGGSLAQPAGVTLEFDYRFDTGNWHVLAKLRNAPGKQFAALLPETMPLPTQGELNGTLRISGGATGVAAVAADCAPDRCGIQRRERPACSGKIARNHQVFSDAQGRHLGLARRYCVAIRRDILAAVVSAWGAVAIPGEPAALAAAMQPADCGSNCQVALPAPAGSTVPCRGGYQLSASGSFDGASLKIEQAIVDLPEAGRVQLAALWDMKQGAFAECTAHAENLALGKLFTDYAKPFLDKGALAESSLYGHADMDWHYRDGATQSLRWPCAMRASPTRTSVSRFLG